MITEEILKLRGPYEETRNGLTMIINEAYGKGLPWYMIGGILENLFYQLKPLIDEEAKSSQSQLDVAPVEPAPAIEEKGETETNE